MQTKDYTTYRKTIRTGDIIAFGGNSAVSVGIKLLTNCNVSHVATVLRTFNRLMDKPIIQIIESVGLKDGVAGVQVNRLSPYIKSYKGNIWHLPLSNQFRNSLRLHKTINWLITQEGKPYDAPQALGAGLDSIFPDNKTDFTRLFCSELCTAGFQVGLVDHDKISHLNPSEMTPADVINFPIYQSPMQLCGPPTSLLR